MRGVGGFLAMGTERAILNEYVADALLRGAGGWGTAGRSSYPSTKGGHRWQLQSSSERTGFWVEEWVSHPSGVTCAEPGLN